MFTLKFTARDQTGKLIRFNVRQPADANAYRHAWERAEKIAARKGWTELKFA